MRFSLVIPTQDRPALLAVAARHAMQLDHPDFELIVSDNSTSDELKRSNAEAVRHWRTAPNFRLVGPSRVLSPPEHFEFALEFASGDYLVYLTDKMVILPRALAEAEAAIKSSGADIVNWGYAAYAIDDGKNPSGAGTLEVEPEFLDGRPGPYDPLDALRFKASSAVPRDRQRARDYALGKIVFGCFSKDLVDRIRSRSGTVFGGATHDYSAMVQALSLARSCVMLNRYEILFIALPRDQSLGSLTASQPQRALQYFRSFTDADSILSALLVPGLYASQHNMVAHDYRKFLPLYGNQRLFNETNWLAAIRGDLSDQSKVWRDPAEKSAQLGLFADYVNREGQRVPLALKALRDRLSTGFRRIPAAQTRTLRATSLDEAIRRVSEGRCQP